MHDSHSEAVLNPTEKQYHDLIRRAEDFMKIEIFRNAKECYLLAMETGVNNQHVSEQLIVINEKIRNEVKTIRMIIGAAVLIIALVILL